MAGPLATLWIDFRAGVAGLDSDMQGVARSLSKAGRNFEKLGSTLTKSLTIPIAAGAAAVFHAAASYDKAQKIIQKQTGATGDALKGLKKDFDAIAGSVPNSFADTAHVIAEVNKRTGETGVAAQDLSKAFLNLSNVTETDLNANLQTGLTLFDTWGVKVGDQVKTIDEFYRASQIAGVGVTELMTQVSSSDAVLGAYGFSLEDSIALMTSFSRGGVDSSKALGALTKAMKFFTDNNIPDVQGALEQLLTSIEETPFSTTVAEQAFKVFGTKIGLEIIDAAKEGRFHYQQYLDVIKNGDETVASAAEKNKSFGEQIKESLNGVNLAIAQGVDPSAFKLLNQGIKELGDSAIEAINWFTELPKSIQETTLKILGVTFVLGPFATAMGLGATAVANLTRALLGLGALKALSFVLFPIYAVLGLMAEAIVPIIAALGLFTLAALYSEKGLKGLYKEFANFGSIEAWRDGFNSAVNIVSEQWAAFTEFFSGAGQLIQDAFVLLMASFGLGPDASRVVVEAIVGSFTWLKDTLVEILQGISNYVAETFNGISESATRFAGNFQRIWLVIKHGGVEAAVASAEYAELEKSLANVGNASTKTGTEFQGLSLSLQGATDSTETLGGQFGEVLETSYKLGESTAELDLSFDKVGKTGKRNIPGLNEALAGTNKAATEAAKAVENIAKRLADSKASAEIDKIKRSIDDLVSGVGDIKGLGSAANIGQDLADLQQKLRDKALSDEKENLAALSGAKLEAAKEVINASADYELQKYQQDLAPKMLEIDKKNHEQTVSFYQGLMEDVISGTRFDFAEQFKKAAVEIAAEFLTNMIEANLFASNSFGELFSGIIDALTKSVNSWFSSSGFGDIVGDLTGGASSGGGFLSGIFDAVSGFFTGGAGEVSGIGPVVSGADYGAMLAGVGEAANGLSAAAGAFDLAAAAPFAFDAAGSSLAAAGAFDLAAAAPFGVEAAAGLSAGATAAGGAAAGGAAAAGLSTAAMASGGLALAAIAAPYIIKGVGDLFEEKLTPNEKSIKKFEGTIEDTLKKSLGKSVNFVVGDIEKFAGPGWADEFWTKFGDKGGDVFQALGSSFENLFGLEGGVGQQIGALLAENLAGGDLLSSLDNIKLFLDSMGISVADLNKGLLDTAKAGNISWHEFESFRQSLEQIPTEGLAAFGNMIGAFNQVLESGGRGEGALVALRNIAIEAGQAGVDSFEALRQSLLSSGADAEAVSALFQAFAQRGIGSIDELKNASDPALGGVIADMETLGVKWADFANDTAGLTDGIGDLADEIRNLSKTLRDIPSSIDTKINVTSSITSNLGDVLPNARGGVLRFAAGGIVNAPTLFPTSSGSLGLMGEAGAEAIMPLARVNGKLGVRATGGAGGSGTYNIYIDASGAKAGVEHDILAAMSAMSQQATMDAIQGAAASGRRRNY